MTHKSQGQNVEEETILIPHYYSSRASSILPMSLILYVLPKLKAPPPPCCHHYLPTSLSFHSTENLYSWPTSHPPSLLSSYVNKMYTTQTVSWRLRSLITSFRHPPSTISQRPKSMGNSLTWSIEIITHATIPNPNTPKPNTPSPPFLFICSSISIAENSFPSLNLLIH